MDSAQIIPLEELCDTERGITYGIVKVGDFIPDGVPVIRGGDIRDGQIQFDEHKRVSEDISQKFSRTILRGGEIIINLIAEPGHSAIVPPSLIGFNVSRDVGVIPLNDSVNNQYVDYFLKSPQCIQWLSDRLQGSVTQKINLSTLKELPIPIIPIGKQDSIAHILGTLDNKIHINHQINQNLESIAQTIFKSWFVDFDPVKAKMEGREPEGMDAETAALFPASLVESELGLIPEGWVVKALSSTATFLNGLAMQKYPAIEGDPYFPVLKIAELRSGFRERTNRANRDIPVDYIVNDGDIIFSWSGSLLVKQWTLGQAALNQHLFKVTSTEYPKWFYYQWALHHLPEFQSIAAGKATTMGHIQRKHLDEAKVFVPSQEILKSATGIFGSMLEMQLNNDINSRTLSDIRDTLLPKLISGEIQIPLKKADTAR